MPESLDDKEEYWLVIVDRGTGVATTQLFTGPGAADRAHSEKEQWDFGACWAAVVGKR